MATEPHPFCDEIHIEQLDVSARIGVPKEERAAPQRLTVSISFWPFQQTRDLVDKLNEYEAAKIPDAWGSPNLGGPIVTAGGVVFIGAALDRWFHAYDVETGAAHAFRSGYANVECP